MKEYPFEMSPRVLARIGGVLYLIIIVGGIFGEAFIRNRAIVSGDAATTAANIKSLESLWRFGIASEIFMLTCAVVLGLIFYVLLRPVNKDLALLAVFFNLVSATMEAANELRLLQALLPLDNAVYLRAFEPEQLHAMMSLTLRSYAYGFNVSLIFFGCECLVLGYLIFRSGYIPKIIGILMFLAGLSYLINSYSLILAPDFARLLGYSLMAPVLAGEGSLCLWLLLKGINVEKWKLQAGIQPVPSEATAV